MREVRPRDSTNPVPQFSSFLLLLPQSLTLLFSPRLPLSLAWLGLGMNAEAMTYAERKAMGFGTVQERLGKDSQGNFYDCCLTLAPAVDPVCTPSGFLYSKQAILENLLQQKKENKRKLRVWEEEQRARSDSKLERSLEEEEARKEAFFRVNHEGAAARSSAPDLATAREAPATTSRDAPTRDEREKAADLRAFWLPSKTPEAEKRAEKPSMACRCPATGKKLKLKDLVPVSFARDPDDPKRYIDPLLKDQLTNRDALVVIKATGAVMKKKTYETLVKPDGVYEGSKVSPKDVFDLQKGGTGFAAHDRTSQSKKHFAVGIGSGLADVRGQSGSSVSRFGLKFNN